MLLKLKKTVEPHYCFQCPAWKAAVTVQFCLSLILQRGFIANSELHVRRLCKKYNKNVHEADFRRVSALYTFYVLC